MPTHSVNNHTSAEVLLHPLGDEVSGVAAPPMFTWPFHYVPHPLTLAAASRLQAAIGADARLQGLLAQGKMLGVLVVRHGAGQLGYLAAFSGNLTSGVNRYPGFVPPVFDLLDPAGEFRQGEAQITALNRQVVALEAQPLSTCALDAQVARLQTQVDKLAREAAASKARRHALRQQGGLTPQQLAALERESQHQRAELKRSRRALEQARGQVEAALRQRREQVEALRQRRRAMSEALQRRIFTLFRVHNACGQCRDLLQVFALYFGHEVLPPGGAGECCAPKLLECAYRHHWQPVCMGEFWWGRSPAGQVRHQGHFYPACRSKCLPILTFMLQGLAVEPNRLEQPVACEGLDVISADEWIVAVNKPAGLLTVPGRGLTDSVLTRARRLLPQATGPLVVHRLDQATSGIVLIAKTKRVHQALQAQFARRQVSKTYVALLSRDVAGDEGTVSLPLRPDVDDRPRQMVDPVHGKPAVTRWRVLEHLGPRGCRVEFTPLTGRTHQLRVHASHQLGLNAPIVGDTLYGTAASRLMLHAAALRFTHPVTGREVVLTSPCPF